MKNCPLTYFSNYHGVYYKPKSRKYKWLCKLVYSGIKEDRICESENAAAVAYNELLKRFKLEEVLPVNIITSEGNSVQLVNIFIPKIKPAKVLKNKKPRIKRLYRLNSIDQRLIDLKVTKSELQDRLSKSSIDLLAKEFKTSYGSLKSYILRTGLTLPYQALQCKGCGVEFNSLKKKKTYCTRPCERKASKREYYKRKSSLTARCCKRCLSGPLEYRKSICISCKTKKYKRKKKEPVTYSRCCKNCNNSFETLKGTQIVCNKSCKKHIPKVTRECENCKTPFIIPTDRSRIRGCSDYCKDVLHKYNQKKWSNNPENKEKKRIAHRLNKRKNRKNKTHSYKAKLELSSIKNSLKASKPKRKDINLIIERLSLFGEGVCCFCNKFEPAGNNRTIEHLLPVCSGGTNDINNLYTSCRECNESKWTLEWASWFREQSFYSPVRELEILKASL